MRRTVFALGSLLTLSLVSVGCAPPEDSVPEQKQEKTAEAEAPIYYGTDDLAHDAVVFLYSEQGFACSGTIIARNGGTAWVLTAAHCDGMDWVVQDDDIGCFFNNPNACDNYWQVDAQTVNPNYNPNDIGAGYDFSIIQFSGADANTPVIPAATNPDGLAGNSQVDIVGYGETETGNSSDVRQHIAKPIVQLDSNLMYFSQTGTSGGACSGDSGGPAIFNGEVVGVTSFGSENCSGNMAFGASGRVQFVANWIAMVTGGTVVENCDTCFEDEVQSPNGDCAPQVDACFNNTACEQLNTCLGGCNGNSTCIQNCANTAGNTAVNLYNAIFDCWCVSCATLCADECDPGSSNTSTGNGLTTSATTGAGGNGAGGAPAAGGGGPNGSDGGSSSNGDGGNAAEDGGDDGCGCSTVGAPERSSSLGWLGLAFASVVVARSRRRVARG